MKPVDAGDQAAQALEATLLRQLLATSGAFKGGNESGDKLRADLFIETLADAVAKAGGLGLARMIERSLPTDAADPLPTTPELDSLDVGATTPPTNPQKAINAYGNRVEGSIAGKPRSQKGDAP